MIRVALRGVRAHLVRFVLSTLAVALGVAFVVGTFAFRAMLSSTFEDIVATTLTADAYVRGQAPAGESVVPELGAGDPHAPVPVALADEVAAVDGVARAYADVSGPVVLLGADDEPVVTGGAPSTAVALHPDDPGLHLTAGAWPAGPGEVALETGAADLSGLRVGDATTVVLGGAPSDVTVSGVFGIGSSTAGAVIVGVDAATAEAAYAPDGTVGTLSVYADPGVSQAALVERLEAVLPDDAQAVTGDALREETRQGIEQLLGFVETFLLVFAAVALFVGAFIIANTFAMSVRERLRELALLRAVGASPVQVFASVLVQAVVVGLLGSAAGVLLGRALVVLLRWVLATQGMELAGRLPLDTAALGLSIALGTAVSVVAAAVPARRAALVPPVQAMRDDVAPERGTLARGVGGAVLTAVGAGVLWLAASLGSSTAADPTGVAWVDDLSPRVLLGVGAGAVLVGVLVLSPAVAPRVIRVLAAPVVAAVRPLGGIARGNVTRSPRRTANTAGALMIGMALVAATGVIAASAQASVASIVSQEMRADLMVQSAVGGVPRDVVDALRALPEVGEVDPAEAGSALAAVPDDPDAPRETVSLAGVPPTFFPAAIEAPVLAGDPAQALAAGEAVTRRTAARDHDWALGDQVEVGGRTLTIGAVVDTQVINTDLIVPDDVYADLVPEADSLLVAVYVVAADGVSTADLRDALTTAVQPYLVLTVLTPEQVASALGDQVDQVLVILYGLLGLSIVIALLGIVNTLALSIAERTREIGLLRAVGLGRLQLAGTIAIESVLTAVYGTVLGVVTGIGIASALPGVLADEGLSRLAVPWGQVLVVLGLAVAIGLVASVWPAVRAARLPVLQAVTTD